MNTDIARKVEQLPFSFNCTYNQTLLYVQQKWFIVVAKQMSYCTYHPNQKVYLKTGIPIEMEVKLEVKMEVEMEVKMDAPILRPNYTGAQAPRYM